MNKSKFTTEDQVRELNEAINLYKMGALSLRNSAQLLQKKTGITISHEGLRKIINKRD